MFVLKSGKSILFLVKENKSFSDTDRGTPFTCRGIIMIPGLLLLSVLIVASPAENLKLKKLFEN